MSAVSRFDLAGPLPTGIAVLEASAGTGKTFTIAGLVARYVAEGYPLTELLVVTFTRAATAELRERVRNRLVLVADHLERVRSGVHDVIDDEVANLLADGTPAEVSARWHRLASALTDFDAATIATIHGFCQHVLRGVGLVGDVDAAAELVEDEGDVIEAVVDDLLVRRFHTADPDDGPTVTRAALRRIAETVVGNPDATIVPGDPDDPAAAVRVALAREVREHVDRRKRTAGMLSYNDLLTRLRDSLHDDVRGPAARRRLRSQYRVALIDEFQDTDPVQWDILAAGFGGGPAGWEDADEPPRALVLIGDPKQAIYSFRGADVHAYLKAAGRAGRRFTLDVNWRSDGDLLEAYNTLFGGAALGHRDILYRPVEPAPPHREARLLRTPSGAALRLRVVPRHGGLRPVGKQRELLAAGVRQHIAHDLAAEIVELLCSAAEIADRDAGGAVTRRRPVRPEDLAVLARTNAEAALVQRTLRDAGVPAVINGVGSVFATTAAGDWLRLLQALERPTSPTRARTAALTAFVGWSAREVATASETAWELLHGKLHRWAGILRDHSVASLLQTVKLHEGLAERLLACRDGERQLTDLEHVGELLHAAATAEELGVTALSGWVRERIAESEEDLNSDERARRLESDAEAVQVLTIHRSKGLEFPVVYCPFLWSSGYVDLAVPVFHDEDLGEGRIADVGGRQAPDHEQHRNAARREHDGENLRLLYVALTRARHQAVVWWAPVAKTSRYSPLARVLFCRRDGGPPQTHGSMAQAPSDDQALATLHGVADVAGGTISVETTPADPRPGRWQPGDGTSEAVLDAARFTRTLDRAWQRTSYSAMTSVRHDPVVGSEPNEPLKDDESLPGSGTGEPAGPEPADALDAVVPLATMPGGTAVGTFVHGVFEHTDFSAEDLDAELDRSVTEQAARRHVDVGDHALLVAGLRRAIETPLGPLASDLALRDVVPADRLDELDFELPLGGGDTPGGRVTLAAVADLLDAHLDPSDPLAGYAERLRDPLLERDVRGFLTGSIDLVLRVRDPGRDRFLVVDHKTNRLAPAHEQLVVGHYAPAALGDAMRRGNYPLQALLYDVALHRFLRWRLPGYDPSANLGGVLYTFVRGMVGSGAPRVAGQPCGVFAWRPPTDLVVALSDFLDRAEVRS